MKTYGIALCALVGLASTTSLAKAQQVFAAPQAFAAPQVLASGGGFGRGGSTLDSKVWTESDLPANSTLAKRKAFGDLLHAQEKYKNAKDYISKDLLHGEVEPESQLVNGHLCPFKY